MPQHELDFFLDLLEETRIAYDRSSIKQKNPDWAYSVSATRILPGRSLILGFNWGAGQGVKYRPQDHYPLTTFGEIEELGSMQRTIAFFEKHCRKALDGMQTNYCFFRSGAESDISPDDLSLSEGLFKKYIDYSKPSRIISFSSSLKEHLKSQSRIKGEERQFKSGNKTIVAMKGTFIGDGVNVPFHYLPHPNFPVTGEAREAAWMFSF